MRLAYTLLVGICLALLIGVITLVIAKPASSVTLRLYKGGKSINLDVSAVAGQKLLAELESGVVMSHDTLRLAVLQEEITAIKKRNALEVVYSSPKSFKLGRNGLTMTIKRLLLPLDGQYAVSSGGQKAATFFYGTNDYEPGPLVSDASLQDVCRRLIVAMGYTIAPPFP